MTREEAESNFDRNWEEMLELQKGKTDWAREEMRAHVKGVYALELRAACISLEAQLKALKAENLAETEMFNKVVKTKDERIKELECRVYHAEGYVITHAENYRICDGCFYTLTIQASMEEIVRAQDTCYSCQRYYSDKFRLKTIEEEENA